MATRTAETRRDRWTGEPIGSVPTDGRDEALAAVDQAAAALARGLPVPRRHAVLAGASALIAARAEEFARTIQRDMGKPIAAARAEVARAVGTLAWAAEEARRLPGERVPLEATEAGAGTFALTIPEPRGIVAAVTPFNFPLNLVAHKVGPALAAGCPVVLKPSDKAPLGAVLLAEALAQAGLEPGWLTLVTGPAEPIVGAWLDDPRVAVLTFTGSAEVGWGLKARSPRKLHILELGSATAMYVHRSADLERAASDAASAGFVNSGQACVSLQRLYVDELVAPELTERLARIVARLPFGDPALETTVVGPLVTDAAAERVRAWIRAAAADGARVVCGGGRQGALIEPTLMTDVPPTSDLVCREVFGPVVSIVPVRDAEHALALVNASDFGLNTSVYTSELGPAMDFAARVESGTVLVNMPPSFRADHMPYGGVKGSGQGREGVRYAVEELVHAKLVVLHA